MFYVVMDSISTLFYVVVDSISALFHVVVDGVPEHVHLLLWEVVAGGVGGELIHGQVHDFINVLEEEQPL
jgi:hypothetical protein